MKKLLYISFIFAFLMTFMSCEKEVVEPFYMESNGTRGGEPITAKDTGDDQTRGGDDFKGDDVIVDPDEDEDFDEEEDDNIVDPDEDEDFDEEEEGK